MTYRRGRTAHLDVGGARGEAIRKAVEDQLGLTVSEIKPVGLSEFGRLDAAAAPGGRRARRRTCSASSTRAPTCARTAGTSSVGSCCTGGWRTRSRSTRVRRLVQQEDYALRVIREAGVPGAKSYGFVELTPEREYMLVTEFLEGAVEIGDAVVDEALIDEALHLIRILWDAGLAHRDIKPANLMVRDGRILLIDVAFAELRPTPWRQAVDLANMMLCLALRSSAQQVYDRALRQFTVRGDLRGVRRRPAASRCRRSCAGRCAPRDATSMASSSPAARSGPGRSRSQRWTFRRVAAALVAAVRRGPARVQRRSDCSAPTRTPTRPVHVDARCDEMEAMWLQAQAVPTAELVPCVATLPVGWSFGLLTANNGRSTITVDHDRAGSKAIDLRFAGSCDVTGATEVSSRRPRRPVGSSAARSPAPTPS